MGSLKYYLVIAVVALVAVAMANRVPAIGDLVNP